MRRPMWVLAAALLVLPAGTPTAGPASAPAAPTTGPASVPAGPVGPAFVPAGWDLVAGGGPSGRALFRWPLDGRPDPVRLFDPPPRPWLPGHRGVDLAGAPDAVVRAAGAGVVLFAGPVAGRPVVTVGHADGLRTTYEPVAPSVPAGTRVAAGTPVGVLLGGHPGCPAAACLHWGLRRGEDYLDPLALLGPGPVRLLPLDTTASVPLPDVLPPASPVAASPVAPPAPMPSAGAGRHKGGAGQRWASSGGSRTASRSYSAAEL